ncbi:MAG: Hsp20/alpha crystallin family protein [Planctomycetaceae bacterium]|nr:Hsp20/alpha crystallin family protein [Planctomycetaceae bacterium]
MSESPNIIRRDTPGAESASPGPVDTTSGGLLFNPPIDIYETAQGLVLYADLPGVSPEGLNLQVQDNRLSLYGEVSIQNEDAQVVHEEYRIGNFLRSFILSDDVDHENITARLNNGVLRVELPRAARAEPRRIEVSSD